MASNSVLRKGRDGTIPYPNGERQRSVIELFVVVTLIECSIWELFGPFGKAFDFVALPTVVVVMIRSWWRHKHKYRTFFGSPAFGLHQACLICLSLTAVMSVGLLLLGEFVRVDGENFRTYWLGKDGDWFLTKTLVVVLQQLALHGFLWPNFRVVFGNNIAAYGGTALVFGLIHLPSVLIVALTALASFAWCWIYVHSRRIAPLIVSHFMLAILAYGALPARLNYNMGVGTNGHEVRLLYDGIRFGPLSELHAIISSEKYLSACQCNESEMISAYVQDTFGVIPEDQEVARLLTLYRGYSPTDIAIAVLNSKDLQHIIHANADERIREMIANAQQRIDDAHDHRSPMSIAAKERTNR